MRSWKRRLANAFGRLAGAHVIPRQQQWEWPEDQFSAELLRRLEIDCVFDVGANSGQFARKLREQGYAGTILSFEPAPGPFELCQAASAPDPRWHVFNYALGEADGTIPFNLLKESKLSSALQPLSGDHVPFSGSNEIIETIEVSVFQLEQMFPRLKAKHGFARPCLKLDTQGYDLRVAAGAGKCLNEFYIILTEMGIKLLYEGSPTIVDSLARFRDWGFSPLGFFSVHPGVMLDPHEFNCYLLRDDLATV